MVVATAMAGWAWRKPSHGTAGITSSEWGLRCLRHTHTPRPSFQLLPSSPSRPPPSSFSSPPMSFNETPHGFVAFSLPLCFSLAILLSDLGNSMSIVPIDWAHKGSGLGDYLSQYIKIGVFIASVYAVMMEFVCIHFEQQQSLSAKMWGGKEALIFYSGDLCNEWKNMSPLWLEEWNGTRGGKIISGAKSIICHIL